MITFLPSLKVLSLSGAMFGLGPVLGLFSMIHQPGSLRSQEASVVGRVTYENRPVTGMLICFSLPGQRNTCCGSLAPDGSFFLRAQNFGEGIAPGEYRVHFETTPSGTKLPAKFFEPDSRELVVQIPPRVVDIQIDLK